MKYNFDEIIDRTKTNALKHTLLKDIFGKSDIIPLWIADMDFLTPPEITKALTDRCEHGIFGYTGASDGYYDSIISWLERRHDYNVDKEEITFIPGVVKGIAFVLDAFTEPGDAVIIQPPVYPPFKAVTEQLKRRVVNNPLILKDGKFEIDFEGLKEIVHENRCKVLILCNPHNPGGRIWRKDELEQLAEICYANNILVISDEIHADLALPSFIHTPFAAVSEKARQNSITLMAPSKTFNIAGIVSSFSIVHNPEIRTKFLNYLSPRELDRGTIFAYTATEAAYNHCDEWLDEAMQYVAGNVDFVERFIEDNIPQIKVVRPEASFLIWLDCRQLGLTQQQLNELFVEQAKLALNDGTTFGKEGEGFMRLNVGTPRAILEQALNNLKEAIQQ